MFSGIRQLNWWLFSQPSALTVFLLLFLIVFYGSIGKFIGLTAATNLRSRDQGVIGLEAAMYVDGIGTVGGALIGTTSIITYVESAIAPRPWYTLVLAHILEPVAPTNSS